MTNLLPNAWAAPSLKKVDREGKTLSQKKEEISRAAHEAAASRLKEGATQTGKSK